MNNDEDTLMRRSMSTALKKRGFKDDDNYISMNMKSLMLNSQASADGSSKSERIAIQVKAVQFEASNFDSNSPDDDESDNYHKPPVEDNDQKIIDNINLKRKSTIQFVESDEENHSPEAEAQKDQDNQEAKKGKGGCIIF
jgi:hypothetical protein